MPEKQSRSATPERPPNQNGEAAGRKEEREPSKARRPPPASWTRRTKFLGSERISWVGVLVFFGCLATLLYLGGQWLSGLLDRQYRSHAEECNPLVEPPPGREAIVRSHCNRSLRSIGAAEELLVYCSALCNVASGVAVAGAVLAYTPAARLLQLRTGYRNPARRPLPSGSPLPEQT
ncbi:hypothetical protein DIPPA_01435 [Diplonema papillatum]|nr:hypothetical protein DIPPA_01435 [Diplonema papillatum]